MTEQQLILIDRKQLEALALETVSPELFYETRNDIEYMEDSELMRIISFGGDYAKELAYQDAMEGVQA